MENTTWNNFIWIAYINAYLGLTLNTPPMGLMYINVEDLGLGLGLELGLELGLGLFLVLLISLTLEI